MDFSTSTKGWFGASSREVRQKRRISPPSPRKVRSARQKSRRALTFEAAPAQGGNSDTEVCEGPGRWLRLCSQTVRKPPERGPPGTTPTAGGGPEAGGRPAVTSGPLPAAGAEGPRPAPGIGRAAGQGAGRRAFPAARAARSGLRRPASLHVVGRAAAPLRAAESIQRTGRPRCGHRRTSATPANFRGRLRPA